MTVTPHADRPGPAIPVNFLGLSVETHAALPFADGHHRFDAANKPLVALYRTLGVRSLRLGGNSVDDWAEQPPTTGDVDALFAFATAADVSVIYSFRLKPSDKGEEPDPIEAAATARYIAGKYGDRLDTFEVGNEPDHYGSGVTSMPAEEYLLRWNKQASAITDAVPTATFAGPALAGSKAKWMLPFVAEAKHGGNRLKYVCEHDYFGGNGTKSLASRARARLVSPDLLADYQASVDALGPAAKAAGVGFRLDETNSLSRGGAPAASDTLAAALWGINYLHWWAAHDAAGINFHTGDWPPTDAKPNGPGGNAYAAYWSAPDGYSAKPLAYAMKAFDLGSHGRRLPVDVGPGATDLSAYAVLRGDGVVCLTLVNVGPAEVKVLTPGTAATACLLTTPGHDLAETAGVTLGGAAIADDGTWAGHPTAVAAIGGMLSVTVPPRSAAVVEVAQR